MEQLKVRLAYQKKIVGEQAHKSEAEELEEMWKWVKISFAVATPICVISAAKDIYLGEHEHEDHGSKPDYMGIRTKAFPWECEDCALFDRDCHRKCKAEIAASKAEA